MSEGGRPIKLHGVGPVHPGRGEPSYIELTLILDYLKGTPVEGIRLTPAEALRLIEQLAMAIRVTS